MHIATSPYDTTPCDGIPCHDCGELSTVDVGSKPLCLECADATFARSLSSFPSYIDEPADSQRPTIPVRAA